MKDREAARSSNERAAVLVRPAQWADRERIVEFQLAMALETEDRRLDLERLRAGVGAVLDDAGRGRYLVAERAGHVVGSLLLTLEWSDWRSAWFWWIQSVYTAPEARGSGVYRALHERVVEEARIAGDVCGLRLYVEEENQAAQRVYETLGMRRSTYRFYELDL